MSKRANQHINFPIVLRFQGWLLLIEAAFMLLPLAVSWWFDESMALRSFIFSTLITAAAGAGMAFGIKPRSTSMHKREGLMLTAIIWVFFSIFGMLPYLFSGTLNNVTDAFFETMAGFTTTGSSVIPNVEDIPRGVLFWRAMTQWIGGMGIILFTLAVIPMLNQKGGIALFNAEVTGITHERLRPRISQTAKDLWLIYIALTALLTVLLYIGPMNWFDAVCHAMTTTSTGGYSTKNIGLDYWQSPYVFIVVIIFMFIGGISFSLIAATMRGNFKRIRHNNTLRWYCMTTLITTVAIFLYMIYMGFLDNNQERFIYGAFDTLSAITSTGFSTFDYENSGEFVTVILMVMMFFGGMAGSTSGGAKMDRLIVLLKHTSNEFYRVLHTNSVRAVHIDGKPVPNHVVSKVNTFFTVYVGLILVVALYLTFYGVPVFDAMYTSMSAISNVGIGHGVTGANGSWVSLHPGAKWVLAFEMMIGRLELFTVLVIFTRSFWKKD
ncbi:MAG: TrkH family potassium uptake protein [Muribaculaceae bacterium]|nr:TrkH family potassium uptake protein [Muribaculaceae bacterium]